jgi:hypothetical protein
MIDFDEIGAELKKFGTDADIILPAIGRIWKTLQKLEPADRASLIADIEGAGAQLSVIGTAIKAIESEDDMQKVGGIMQLARIITASFAVAARLEGDAQTVLEADWSVNKPDAILIFNTLKGTTA